MSSYSRESVNYVENAGGGRASSGGGCVSSGGGRGSNRETLSEIANL